MKPKEIELLCKMQEKSQTHPVEFCKEIMGIDTLGWQGHLDIINAIATHNRVSVKSGHSMGKDFVSGVIANWFLYSFPQSIVITTAPTERQVEHIIWGEISKYHKRLKIPTGKINRTSIQIADDWYALGFTTKDSESVGKFQGFKGRNVLVIVTEAQAVEDSIFQQIEAIMTSDNSRLYLAGNALINDGEFYRSFFPGSGYKTFSYSCYDSPNYIEGREVIPGMVGRAWVEDKEKRWGKDSVLFKSRVLAEFPEVGIDTLIGLNVLMKVINKPMDNKTGFVSVGADIARYGDAETVFTCVKGTQQIKTEVYTGIPLTETAGRLMDFCRRMGAYRVVIDDAGIGGGVTDILRERVKEDNIQLVVDGLNVGRKSWSVARYFNLRSQIFWQIREMMIKGECSILEDQDLHNQLVNIKYTFNSKGQIKIETKEEMRSRGVSSPDRADALMLALFGSTFGYEPPEKEIQDFSVDYFDALEASQSRSR